MSWKWFTQQFVIITLLFNEHLFTLKGLYSYLNESFWRFSNCLIWLFFFFLCCPVSCCVQVLAAVGHQEAERRFQKLLSCLSHPPSYTCVRASTHLAPLEEIRHKLGEELQKVNPNIFWDVVAVAVSGVLINQCWWWCCCCCRSSRCAARQQMRRSPFGFSLTREFQMCCSFPWMGRGMWGMLESESALWKYALRA